MIVWIDGACGVGKSSVASKLINRFSDEKIEYVDSDADLYWEKTQQKYPDCFFRSGTLSYNNLFFISTLRNDLENRILNEKAIVVAMTLAHDYSKKFLLEYFRSKQVDIMHIILMANVETIINRIKNDSKRTRKEQEEQVERVVDQINYLKANYQEAVWIDTEHKSSDNVVEQIFLYLEQHLDQ